MQSFLLTKVFNSAEVVETVKINRVAPGLKAAVLILFFFNFATFKKKMCVCVILYNFYFEQLVGMRTPVNMCVYSLTAEQLAAV